MSLPLNRLALPLAVALLLAGCAVSSTVDSNTDKSQFDGAVYAGETTQINPALPGVRKHRIFHQGSTGFVSVETIRNSAMERVRAFCAPGGDIPYLIQETASTPPHILGNWPRIEITFSCVKPPASSVPAGPAPAPAPGDKYDRLAKLKALLDSGAVTPQEYETEKKKILSD